MSDGASEWYNTSCQVTEVSPHTDAVQLKVTHYNSSNVAVRALYLR